MAEKQAPVVKKTIEVKVVSNYGRHRPGDVIAVEEREYLRLRESILDENGKHKGAYKFPVLISRPDEAKLLEQQRAEEEARKREAEERRVGEDGAGWTELEKESLERVRTSWRERNERERAELFGGDSPRAA